MNDNHRETDGSHTCRILLVEDHEDTRAALSHLLKSHGHEVVQANSVAGALHEINMHRFDLLITDLGLPDGCGRELMSYAQGRHGTRGVVLSGYGMKTDVDESIAAGFDAHLIKPFDFTTLQSVIARVVGTA